MNALHRAETDTSPPLSTPDGLTSRVLQMQLLKYCMRAHTHTHRTY